MGEYAQNVLPPSGKSSHSTTGVNPPLQPQPKPDPQPKPKPEPTPKPGKDPVDPPKDPVNPSKDPVDPTKNPPATTTTPSNDTTPTNDTDPSHAQLGFHNLRRAEHSTPPLKWNTTLATYAKNYAANCKMEHSSGPYGENLASGWGDPDVKMSHDLFEYWMTEGKNYDYSSTEWSDKTGHFTQIMWYSATDLGCAIRSCDAKTAGMSPQEGLKVSYLICNYGGDRTVSTSTQRRTNRRESERGVVLTYDDFAFVIIRATTPSPRTSCLPREEARRAVAAEAARRPGWGAARPTFCLDKATAARTLLPSYQSSFERLARSSSSLTRRAERNTKLYASSF